MAKKIWYSKPLANIWSYYNSFYKKTKGTPIQFVQERELQLMQYQMFGSNPMDIQTDVSVLDMWKLDVTKRFTHIYFKSQSLKDFLCDTKIADLQSVMDYIFENGEFVKLAPSLDGKIPLGESAKMQSFAFGLHIPYENRNNGYAFHFLYGVDKILHLVWSRGENQGFCSADNYDYNLTSSEEHADFLSKTFRLAVNTLAYMKAFPECVTEGVPPTEQEECSYTLDISDKIVESVNHTNKVVVPHFRKGYFKVLRSEFYTEEKRGQMIFVHETMVNGKAKTVEKSNNEEKLSNFSNT